MVFTFSLKKKERKKRFFAYGLLRPLLSQPSGIRSEMALKKVFSSLICFIYLFIGKM